MPVVERQTPPIWYRFSEIKMKKIVENEIMRLLLLQEHHWLFDDFLTIWQRLTCQCSWLR